MQATALHEASVILRVRGNVIMTISIATKLRNRTLILLKIERIQLYEQMALLGYREEKAAPMKLRGNIPRRPRAFVRLENFPLASM